MFRSTLSSLRCPKTSAKRGATPCASPLRLHAEKALNEDVLTGALECPQCLSRYPILAGVAVLVEDPRAYLIEHVKGVPEADFPKEYARELKAAKAELRAGHIEDDLEAERVISLYLMNHYLSARGDERWWQPRQGGGSPLIDELVRRFWDEGPLERIARGIAPDSGVRAVELGCGVGGLSVKLAGRLKQYLGVDSSFASILLARHLALGAPYRGKVRIPEDLLQGPVSRELPLGPPAPLPGSQHDFVVGHLEAVPVERGAWDLSIALNAIDMLEEPWGLPAIQRELARPDGTAIQSCPYIWHERVARKLRARLPKDVRDSAGAAEWLYREAGFEILSREEQVPWLFFKHVRQLELYSVHLFRARLKAPSRAKGGAG